MGRKAIAINPECGKRLASLLEKYGIQQKTLADKLAYTPQQISRIVTGKDRLTEIFAKRVIDFIKAEYGTDYFETVRFDYLMGVDNFETEGDRIHSITTEHTVSIDLVTKLIENAGYIVENVNIPCLAENDEIIKQYPPDIDLEKIFSHEQQSENSLIPPGAEYNEFISRTEGIRFVYKPSVRMKSPKGSSYCFQDTKEYMDMVQNICDFAAFQCATKFKRLIDGARHLYDWK